MHTGLTWGLAAHGRCPVNTAPYWGWPPRSLRSFLGLLFPRPAWTAAVSCIHHFPCASFFPCSRLASYLKFSSQTLYSLQAQSSLRLFLKGSPALPDGSHCSPFLSFHDTGFIPPSSHSLYSTSNCQYLAIKQPLLLDCELDKGWAHVFSRYYSSRMSRLSLWYMSEECLHDINWLWNSYFVDCFKNFTGCTNFKAAEITTLSHTLRHKFLAPEMQLCIEQGMVCLTCYTNGPLEFHFTCCVRKSISDFSKILRLSSVSRATVNNWCPFPHSLYKKTLLFLNLNNFRNMHYWICLDLLLPYLKKTTSLPR